MKPSKLKSILDSIYTIPVILDYLSSEKSLTELQAVMDDQAITIGDIKELNGIRSLLEYHLSVIQNNFQGNYPLLRKGLDEYFNMYLSHIFHSLGMKDITVNFLDYCCGNGSYGKQFLIDNPMSQVTFLDRDIVDGMDFVKKCMNNTPGYDDVITLDFEKIPNWYEKGVIKKDDIEGYFGVVLLSEILHCKNKRWKQYLIESSHKLLHPKGLLIINENDDWPMQYRINKIKNTEENYMMKPSDVADLMKSMRSKGSGFELINQIQINSHNIFLYEKI